MKKKLLSFLLSMVMLFSLLPFAAIPAAAATVSAASVTQTVENYWNTVTANGTKSAYWNASKNEARDCPKDCVNLH